MEKKEILRALIMHYADGNQTQFALLLGIKPQTITSWLARNSFDIDLIYAKCVNISGDWLLSGQGSMLRHEEHSNHIPDDGKMIETSTATASEQSDSSLTSYLQGENAKLHARVRELERNNAILEYRLEQFVSSK